MVSNYSERIKRIGTRLTANPWMAEHGRVLLLYLALSIGLTWPMMAHFTTQIVGNSYDAYNGLWVMWHTKEAVLGHQPFFDLPVLYYPHGATLLTHVPGPATGFFALPFWFLGPEAAHNGAVLISFILTAYFTYLLGRTIGLDRPSSFLAGLLISIAPMHLLGLRGHTTKVFLGAAPLVLLCLFRALDLDRTKWSWGKWAVATALALLFAMLHDSFQFLTAGAAVLLVLLYRLVTTSNGRIQIIQRFSVVVLASMITVGPLLYGTAQAAYDSNIVFDLNYISFDYQPDVIEFVVPSVQSRLLGPVAADIFQTFEIDSTIETAISISLVAYLLMLAAAIWGKRQARFWLAFTFVWVILSVGPTIRFLNHTTFTEYNLPIIMPYAFLTQLPGLDFLRTPGRFMQIGFVGVGIAAAVGLNLLRHRWPNQAKSITICAFALVLLESWPAPFQLMTLRPVPEIYHQAAEDDEMYGVLDLPVTFQEIVPNIMYNATYQMYQMAHGKGIAMGYISRTYRNHPVFPCVYDLPAGEMELRVNGEPAPCPFKPLYDLPLNNYRYIVIHKPQPEYFDYKPGAQGEADAAEFVDTYLSDQTPIIDDALTTVYEMPPTPDLSLITTTLGYGANWYAQEVSDGGYWRWADTPAKLIITSPIHQEIILELMIHTVYVPPDAGEGYQSLLQMSMDNGFQTTVQIAEGKLTAVPLQLAPGQNILTLDLEAGSFQPLSLGGNDPRYLSFAVNYINLQTTSP